MVTPLQAVAGEFDYLFHWGRLSVAEFSLTVPDQEPGVIRVEGSTVGLVGKIFNYDGAISADYSDMGEVLFEVSGMDNHFAERRVIKFAADKPAEILEFLDDEQEQPEDALVQSMGVTLEPLRLVYLFLQQGEQGCEGELPVFDGKRHYRLSLQAVGWDELESDREWGFSGKAMRCELSVSYLETTSGEELNPWYEDSSEVRNVWLAEVDQAFVPVRVTMPGPIGKVTGRLKLP